MSIESWSGPIGLRHPRKFRLQDAPREGYWPFSPEPPGFEMPGGRNRPPEAEIEERGLNKSRSLGGLGGLLLGLWVARRLHCRRPKQIAARAQVSPLSPSAGASAKSAPTRATPAPRLRSSCFCMAVVLVTGRAATRDTSCKSTGFCMDLRQLHRSPAGLVLPLIMGVPSAKMTC